MALIPIDRETGTTCPLPGPAFALGFRPFFLAAAVFAVLAIAVWMADTLGAALPTVVDPGLSPMAWHGHEMIYGYAMAVVAGFLLTASRNWTGRQTLHGWPLFGLCLIWALARLLPFVPAAWALPAMAVSDLVFDAGIMLAVLRPILAARLWPQIGLWSKLVFLLLGNLAFYLGAFDRLEDGGRIGLFIGLYLILSLILTLARRLLPFFIERTVAMDGGEAFTPRNERWLDVTVIFLMLGLMIADVFIGQPVLTALLAAALAGLHGRRLAAWHHPIVWRHPLLWVLFLAYAWIIAGFTLFALTPFAPGWRMLAIHAFAYGGIGLMTLGMMARVSLGHTGRDIHRPPAGLRQAFALLVIGTICRVALPVFTGETTLWIVASQIAWIVAFAIFVRDTLPILTRPRIDGRPG